MLLTSLEHLLIDIGLQFEERDYGEDILAKAMTEEMPSGRSGVELASIARRDTKGRRVLLKEYEEGGREAYSTALIALYKERGIDLSWLSESEFLLRCQNELFLNLVDGTDMPFFWREGIAPNQLKVRLVVHAINEDGVDIQREYRPVADQLVRRGRIKAEEVKIILPDSRRGYNEVLRTVDLAKVTVGGSWRVEAEVADTLGLLKANLSKLNDAVQRVVSLNGAEYDSVRVAAAITPLLTMDYHP